MIGRVLSRYRILEEVGRGGMAVVYRGLDTSLGREVAVKVLHPHLAGDAESRARLDREAQAVAKLRHENILEIFDYSGVESGDSFIVTEFIHGPTLTRFLRDYAIPLPEVAAMIVSEIARGLEHAHGLGVIHRDIKPENVMIRADGRVVLTDFGIAQIVDKERMTVTGQLLGSPAYMSPEHVEGGRLDFRTDVFACGILAYQLATGQLPFRGRNPHEVLKRIAECQYAPPEQVNPLISHGLARIITRALARNPDERYPGLGPMRRDLLAELALAGVTDPREELRGFFADPEGWTQAFKPRLVEALMGAGKQAMGQGRTAAALGLWGRGLAVAPQHGELRALVDRLGQRRRLRRLAGLGAGAVVLVGATTWGLLALRPPPWRPDMGAPPGSVVAAVFELPAAAPRPAVAAPSLPTRLRTEARRFISPPRPREVQLRVFPKNVEIFIDEQHYGSYDGTPIKVPGGRHRLRLRNEQCCTDAVVDLADGQTATELIRLPWKNGSLIFKTTPEDANIVYTVEIDRTPRIARGGQSIAVPFRDHGNPQMKVSLTVTAPGYRAQEAVCIAKAGLASSCSVDLQRQRRPE